jgi:hypothetical protein
MERRGRRASWQTDFLLALDGVGSYHGERKFKFQGPQPRLILLRLKGRLGAFVGDPMIAPFRLPCRAHPRYAQDDDPGDIRHR